ncbi:endonuclease/exonuclease/phosphatase family protein [Luedemannella flava]
MTLNVCGLPSRLAPLPERATLFGGHVERSDLDVVMFQEVWSARILATLKAQLPSFPHVAVRHGLAGQPAGGLATFSRLPLVAPRYTSYRWTRPDMGSPRFRIKRAVNGALQGVLTAEVAGLGVVVANTHLTANKDGDWSAGNRYHAFHRRQLGRLHEVLRGVGTDRAVVAGDFNIAADSALYPLIVDSGAWHDPFAATDPVTFHAEYLPDEGPAHRIDYLLVRGSPDRFVIEESEVLFAAPVRSDDGRSIHASDHMALSARVRWRD